MPERKLTRGQAEDAGYRRITRGIEPGGAIEKSIRGTLCRPGVDWVEVLEEAPTYRPSEGRRVTFYRHKSQLK